MNECELYLEGTGGGLIIKVGPGGWAQFYLLHDGASRFLGAEDAQVIASRLLSNLEDEGGEIAGELAGHKVRWVISLAEAHHTLYFYFEEGVRVLLWQDAEAELVGVIKLSVEQYGEWRRHLEKLAAGERAI